MENILLGFRLEERRQGMGLKGNIRDLCDDRTASVSCQVVVTRPINVVKLNRMKYTHIHWSMNEILINVIAYINFGSSMQSKVS